jgi:uncharacterized damage-inducible protein DinB
MPEPHAQHINRITAEFNEAMTRFLTRLERAGARGDVSPADGEWSVGQIAWHVALVNEAFAGLIAGSIPGPAPAPAGFVERDWQDVRNGITGKLEASRRVRPPADARLQEAIEKLQRSADALRTALGSLTAERGSGFTLKSPIVGEISVYQIGEWATAHVIRHNAQAKRVLGG